MVNADITRVKFSGICNMFKGKSHKELVQVARTVVQPLSHTFYKGQAGKIAVVGGCEDYTGAPFFSSHSAGLVGADLSHIVCERQAAAVIKLYSPDLMVHPYLYELLNPLISQYLSRKDIAQLKQLPLEEVFSQQKVLDDVLDELVMPKVVPFLQRVDVVVMGPGSGRDPMMLRSMVKIIEQLKVMNKTIILDADALFLVSLNPDVIRGYGKAIVTPNVIEFDRLARAVGIASVLNEKDTAKLVENTVNLSIKLGDITVVHKNATEIIAHRDNYIVNQGLGTPRRVGGQGDTLTGALATFVNWSQHYHQGFWDREPTGGLYLSEIDLRLIACFGAATLVRTAAEEAFAKFGRSMQTTNVHQFLGEAYKELYGQSSTLRL